MSDVTGTVFFHIFTIKKAYYIAPEVLRENYNEKCDIWSCGVIMYMLLTGTPPFIGNTNEEIMKKVEKGNASFTGPLWKRVSQEAVALVKKMLTYNPKSRISAEAALSDPWFKRFDAKKTNDSLEVLGCVKNLKQFKVQTAMQQAVLTYMAGHMIGKDEEKKLREIFKSLDMDHNGLLSIDELTEGYRQLFNGDMVAAKEEAKKTMENIDVNLNGTIDYNGIFCLKNSISKEFLMANMKKQDFTNASNLRMAFDFFDENHDGSISVSELQRVFSGIKGEDILNRIIGETDSDKDGEVFFLKY